MKKNLLYVIAIAAVAVISIVFIPWRKAQVELPEELKTVDMLANEDPLSATEILKGMEGRMKSQSEYVYNRYRLICIKARDKAFIMATDDGEINELVAYFDRHGTDNDRMMAHYYQGSTYRDLHDSPRAIQAYLRAATIGEKAEEGMDTLLLCNIYVQTAIIYEHLCKYKEGIDLSKKALALAEEYGQVTPTRVMDLATLYSLTEKKDSTDFYFSRAREMTRHRKIEKQDLANIAEQLSWYSRNGKKQQAQECLQFTGNT